MIDSQKKILVVDDDINIAYLLKKILEALYDVHVCHELADALDLVDENNYDLVITDLGLGKDSGLTLAKYVREKDSYIEVIIVTGNASVESAREAIDLGVVSYLTKPIDVDQLRTLVKRSVMTHAFNSRTKNYLEHPKCVSNDMKGHMADILVLYSFISKMNQTVELQSTVHVLLKEVSSIFPSTVAVLGVSCLGFEDLYVHTNNGFSCSEEESRELIAQYWNSDFSGCGLSVEKITSGITPLSFIDIETPSIDFHQLAKPFVIPLISYGENW